MLSALFKKKLDKSGDLKEDHIKKMDRLLFIGFGTIPGHFYFSWSDKSWLNAADYQAIFINQSTLSEIIDDIKNRIDGDKVEERSPFIEDFFDDRLMVLKGQLTQVINSQRPIFAIVDEPQSFWYKVQPIGYRIYSSADWCPLPYRIDKYVPGEVIEDVNPKFSDYRKKIKKWTFAFISQVGALGVNNGIYYLPPDPQPNLYINKLHYMLTPQPLFNNLSGYPLGLELRILLTNFGERDDNGRPKIESVSGPVYLLHHPNSGDLQESLKILVKKFCDVSIEFTKEPEWINDIPAPKGEELDFQIKDYSDQIENLLEKVKILESEKLEMSHWRKLIYETGDVLEDVVLEAFEMLGLLNAHKGDRSEYDIYGEFEGNVLIFEIKGKKTVIGRTDVFDLNRHIEEYERKNPGHKVSKGIVVGNSYKDTPPAQRNSFCDGDAVKHAELLLYALLDTKTLYRMVKGKIENSQIDKTCFWEKLIRTVGVFKE